VKPSSPNVPSNWLIFLCPHTHASLQTCRHSASSVLAVPISCCVISSVCVQKAKRRMEKSVNTHNRLRYFLTNKIFLLQVMYRYVHMILIVKCVTETRFFIAYAALWWKSIFYCSVIPWNCTWYRTVQVLYFFIALLSLED
jgi:hypothetical protein